MAVPWLLVILCSRNFLRQHFFVAASMKELVAVVRKRAHGIYPQYLCDMNMKPVSLWWYWYGVWHKYMYKGTCINKGLLLLLTNYETITNRVFVSLGIKQRNSRNAARLRLIRSSLPLLWVLWWHYIELTYSSLNYILWSYGLHTQWHDSTMAITVAPTPQSHFKRRVNARWARLRLDSNEGRAQRMSVASGGGFYKDVTCAMSRYFEASSITNGRCKRKRIQSRTADEEAAA